MMNLSDNCNDYMMSSSFYAEMPHESKEKMNQPNTMKEMPEAERPYEKCEKMGAEKLTDVELLAVLLRTGSRGENAVSLARRILYGAEDKGILGLHQFSLERLRKIKGIGRVKAVQISWNWPDGFPRRLTARCFLFHSLKPLPDIIWKTSGTKSRRS